MSIRCSPNDLSRLSSRVSSHEKCCLKMQTAYEELHSRAHENNRKRHDLAISLNFISQQRKTRRTDAISSNACFAKCQFEIEEKKRRKIKILERFASILIGLFAFWPYTDRGFFPLLVIKPRPGRAQCNLLMPHTKQFCISK